MAEHIVPLTPDEAREIIKMLGEWANFSGTNLEAAVDLSKRLEEMVDQYASKLALTLEITLNWCPPFNEDTYRE